MEKQKSIFTLTNNEKLNKAIENSINDKELHFSGDETLEKCDMELPEMNYEEMEKWLDVVILDEAEMISKFDRNVKSPSTAIDAAMPAILHDNEEEMAGDRDDKIAMMVYKNLIRRMARDAQLHSAIRECEMDLDYVHEVLSGPEEKENEELEVEKSKVKKSLEQELDDLATALQAEAAGSVEKAEETKSDVEKAEDKK